VDNTATVKITKTGSDKTNIPPVIIWASLCLTGTNECYKPPLHLSRELKKVINPDTKHIFTTYSLIFSKESNLSSKLVPVQELSSPVNVRMPID